MRTQKLQIFKTTVILIVLSVVLVIPYTLSAVDHYPTKPVRLIVMYPPGGATDIIARIIAAKLSERLEKPVVVENQGGAGGVIGAERVAKASPDGYTLLFSAASFTIQPALENLPYDPVKSFAAIAKLGSGPYVLSVHPSVQANSVKEFIALAKQKPGQLIFATAGIGGTPHVSAELFKMMTGIDVKIVHFKGAGPALIDVLGGHSHAIISAITAQVPHIKSGKLKALANCGEKRSIILPDLQTISEAGLPEFKSTGWQGIFAPAGTPAPIVERLSKEIKAVLALDEVQKMFMKDGSEADYLGPTEFGAFIEEEINRWVSVVKKANIRIK